MSKPSDRQPTFFAYLYQLYHICLCVFYIFSLSIYSFVRLVRPLFAVVQGSIRGLTVQSCRSTFQIQILMHENARPITAPSQATNPKIRRVRKSLQKMKMSHSSYPPPLYSADMGRDTPYFTCSHRLSAILDARCLDLPPTLPSCWVVPAY